MPSMLSTAIQNTLIKAAANLTAQVAAQWTAAEPAPLDRQRICEFAIYGFVAGHIGYAWHHALEHKFPTHPAHPGSSRPVLAPGEKDKDVATMPPLPAPATTTATGAAATRISWRNILAKLVADQTVGFAFTLAVFLTITNIARVPHLTDLVGIIQDKLFQLLRAGWHIWPLVAVCNFLWVPVKWRVIVSSCAGFLWSIFLSLVSVADPVQGAKSVH